MGSLKVGHDWATSLPLFTFMHWRRKCNPLQCSCLENPRDTGAWWAAVYGVAQSRTLLKWLSSSSVSMSIPPLHSSHPPLPLSSLVCFLCLYFYFRFANKIICTIFCKSRKSRNTWSNRQIWPWSTEWSRVKAIRVCQENALIIANTLL